MGRQIWVWAAFLSVCFLLVGLMGLFALYAAPVPLQRALAQSAVLDRALIASQHPDPAKLMALRPELGRSAEIVLNGPGTMAERVVRARAAMQARMEREAAVVTARIRLLIVVMTVMAGFFGVAILGLSGRADARIATLC